ncbi:hypothetical protein Pla100_38570 [Neorhodopirellula pilleata]|uniref:Uncharacterized protein n=1 Tax=Neorhodopirellula pilleata TaxID=2714738 RepID=A0A5C6A4F3_9BACT|nr:hypothetical protein Pla100_38570 [Neorhodopirellula pilleata]
MYSPLRIGLVWLLQSRIKAQIRPRKTKKGEAGSEEPTPPRTGGRLISWCSFHVVVGVPSTN